MALLGFWDFCFNRTIAFKTDRQTPDLNVCIFEAKFARMSGVLFVPTSFLGLHTRQSLANLPATSKFLKIALSRGSGKAVQEFSAFCSFVGCQAWAWEATEFPSVTVRGTTAVTQGDTACTTHSKTSFQLQSRAWADRLLGPDSRCACCCSVAHGIDELVPKDASFSGDGGFSYMCDCFLKQ